MLFRPSLKQMSQDLQDALKREVERQGVAVLHVTAFGYLFDRAFWIAVRTDAERDRLNQDEALMTRLKGLFDKKNYIQQARKEHGEALAKIDAEDSFDIGIVFESQETVERDNQGNWWYAMR